MYVCEFDAVFCSILDLAMVSHCNTGLAHGGRLVYVA